jgi:DNA-binding transcriptional MerR regulator
MLGITPVTLRRWCEYHAKNLSTSANPRAGKARRLTGRDLEGLKHVRALPAQGLTVAAINEQLQALTFAVVDTDEPSAGDSKEIASTAAQEESPSTQMFVMVVLDLQRRFDAMEQARQEDRRKRIDTVSAMGLGCVGGLLFCAILILLAWLYGG